MSKKISLLPALLILIFAMLITFMATYILVKDKPTVPTENGGDDTTSYTEQQKKIIDKFVAIDNLFSEQYIGEPDYEAIEDYMMYGYAAGTGDRYCTYWSKDEVEAQQQDAEGTMVGIGVNVIYDSTLGCIEIVNVMPNSPALKAGIQKGDYINTVEGEIVADLGYAEAVNRVLGEEGTAVHFTVIRSGEEIPFEIVRATCEQQDVFSHIYAGDSKIGVIRINDFTGKTYEQFVASVESLEAQGAEKFVFDVRGNMGGNLVVICNILDYLLPEGPIVRIVDADGVEEEVITSDESHVSFPMVVLTDSVTASAAELFSSAIQDYAKAGLIENATLLGTTTYGKGVMQQIYYLNDGTGFKLSVSKYNPPFSPNYDGVGVVPDVILELSDELKNVSIFKFTDENDNQLKAAVDILNK